MNDIHAEDLFTEMEQYGYVHELPDGMVCLKRGQNI